jgi:hypothetical protein
MLFFSHGWCHQVALPLQCVPQGMGYFWMASRRLWEGNTHGPLFLVLGTTVEEPTLLMCDLGYSLASLGLTVHPPTLESQPASHAGLSCSGPASCSPIPSQRSLSWAKQQLCG